MRFNPVLQQGVLIRRYKRFLADVQTLQNEILTIHCPNTGSMKNCSEAGAAVWFSESDNKKRKYRHTWEIVTTPLGFLAGINTGRANHLVREAIETGVVTELQGYDSLRAEVRYGEENSRIDFLLEQTGRPACYVEVKNVTLEASKSTGQFPDAVSQRGSKHLRELMAMLAQGHRAVLFYCVQHTGIQSVSPAEEIDTVYATTLREAVSKGLEVLVYGAKISAEEIVLMQRLMFIA